MELLVVGAGAVGRWFAAQVNATVAFTDTDPEVAERAAGEADARVISLDDDVRFDAVVVAVPIPAAREAIATHASKARAAILDLTGSMAGPLAAMAEHAEGREQVSLHPLFAPENAPGRIAVVVAESGPVSDELRTALSVAGNELFETTAGAHDRAMETVQAKTHLALLAFGLAADEVDPRFATPVYERLVALLAEVTGGEPRVYADIQATFDGAEAVVEAADALAAADRETFERLFRDAGA